MSNLFPSSQHPYLLYSKEVSKALQEDKRIIRDSKLLRKIANALDDLNDHGTNPEYHSQGNLEPLGEGLVVFKPQASKQLLWRIMFRKAELGLGSLYVSKKRKQNHTEEMGKYKRVAKREGWL